MGAQRPASFFLYIHFFWSSKKKSELKCDHYPRRGRRGLNDRTDKKYNFFGFPVSLCYLSYYHSLIFPCSFFICLLYIFFLSFIAFNKSTNNTACCEIFGHNIFRTRRNLKNHLKENNITNLSYSLFLVWKLKSFSPSLVSLLFPY